MREPVGVLGKGKMLCGGVSLNDFTTSAQRA